MGIGDELMAAGEARALHKANGLPVVIVGAHGRTLWSPVWENVPYILKRYPGGRVNRLVNGGGVRPYIEQKTPTRWYWRPYVPKPAEMVFTPAELAFAHPYRGLVIIEPNVKDVGHSNKAWPWDRWQQLVREISAHLMTGYSVGQCIAPGAQVLDGVNDIATPTFRHAAAVLSVAKAFVGTDSGLMHAAAAVGTPAVILWSEFTAPNICGYSSMVNLRHAGKPCGNRLNCKSCRAAMDAITVAEVATALKGILK